MPDSQPTSDTDGEAALPGWEPLSCCPYCQAPLGEQRVRVCPNCGEALSDDAWETFQPVRGKLFRTIAILILIVVALACVAIIALSITSPL